MTFVVFLVGDKTIEQRDLAVDVADRSRRGLFRQKVLRGFCRRR
jgi:hypothetical protein